MATEIHPTALIEKTVLLDDDVSVGPFCILKGSVKVGKGTRLVSGVIVEGKAEIGENCVVHPFATIGLPPQDTKYKGEETGVHIGSGNTIREYVSIHRGSVSGDGVTSLGDNNFLMAYVHVAHDCKLGNGIIIANSVGLSGHVEVEDFAFIGGMVGVHQHTRIGAYTMVGGMSRVPQDIPPFVVASGYDEVKLYGINSVGLKRKGFSEDTINELKKAYKILFRENNRLAIKQGVREIFFHLMLGPLDHNLIQYWIEVCKYIF